MKLFQNSKGVVGSAIFGRVMHGLVGIWSASLLGPSAYGILRTINYIPTIAKFGSLGFEDVVKRENLYYGNDPAYVARKELTKDVGFSLTISWGCILFATILGISFHYENREVVLAMYVTSLTLFCVMLQRILNVNAALAHRFNLIAGAEAVSAIVFSLAALILLPLWGIVGLVSAGLCGAATSVIWLRRGVPFGFQWRFQWSEAVRQLKVGVPLMMGTFAFGAFGWCERIMMGEFFGLRVLGIYMFGVFLAEAAGIIGSSAMRVANVRINRALGVDASLDDVFRALEKNAYFLVAIASMAGGAVWLGTPALIAVVGLEAYEEVLVALPLIYWGLVVDNLAAIPGASMNSKRFNQQIEFALSWGLAIAFYFSAFVLFGAKLAILGAFFCRVGASLARLISILWHVKHGPGKGWSIRKAVLGPLALAAIFFGVCAVLDRFLTGTGVEVRILVVSLFFTLVAGGGYALMSHIVKRMEGRTNVTEEGSPERQS